MNVRLLILLLVFLGIYSISSCVNNLWVDYDTGEIVEVFPRQVVIKDKKSFKYKEFTVTPLAEFEITARVLSKCRYFFGKSASLVPYDLALGWGPMSDSNVLKDLKIFQFARWYNYYYKLPPPIPVRKIINNSANMHLIPSSDEIKKEISKARRGKIVNFSGYLVKVNAKGGWNWRSSLTRSDSGNNSCELVWVEEFYVE